MKETMQDEQHRLKALIQQLEEELKLLPKGTFYQVNNRHQIKWFCYLDGSDTLIKKSDKAFAYDLACATFARFRLKSAKTELSAVNAYLRKARSSTDEEYLQKHSEIRKLLIGNPSLPDKIREWAAAPYKKPEWNYKGPLYKTLKGDLVRSRAEKDIADALFLAGIPYRYECGISFNGKTYYYPDFTIMHPVTGELYIWEHFGMEELEHYRNKNADKMYVYFENGYIPGKNLICSSASDERKLTKSKINKIIQFYFS